MPHRIEVFSANCPLCNEVVDEIEAGRCTGCQLTVYNMSDNLELARSYGVRVVPTVIIDSEVKIEGRPDIPFVCSDETYTHFKKRYPLAVQLTRAVRRGQQPFTIDPELTKARMQKVLRNPWNGFVGDLPCCINSIVAE